MTAWPASWYATSFCRAGKLVPVVFCMPTVTRSMA